MVQQKNVRKDSRLQRQIEELQKRMDAMEDILDNAKEVLSVEEAARFSDRSIPFYRPNGKMIYFEKADILEWIRKNRVMSVMYDEDKEQEPVSRSGEQKSKSSIHSGVK